MKVCALIVFLSVAAFVAAGPPKIPNHPVCEAIMNEYYHSFPDPDDCKCFYKCDWADAIRFCCPADNETPNEDGYLVFNPTLQVCDRKPAAEAGGAICPGSGVTTPGPSTPKPECHSTTPAPPVSSTTTEAPIPSDGCSYREDECPADNAYYHSYIHETCDNKWCQCDWGKGILQPCPAGLIFNDVLQVCDWPKSAESYNIC